jgi:hypothetical protein
MIKIKEEGIYIFGGCSKQGEAQNSLYLLQFGQKPVKMKSIQTMGHPPNPRY